MSYRPAGGSLRVLQVRPLHPERARKARGGLIAMLIGLMKRPVIVRRET